MNIPKVDVVGVGLNATDTLIPVPRFPESGSKVEILSANALLGGQVATAMAACQGWGLHTRYIGKVGQDHAAMLHREEFERLGVETHLFTAPGCPSQQAFILVEPTGERTVLWKRDGRLALLPEELECDWIVNARVLHLDGHDMAAATQAAQWARKVRLTGDRDLYASLPRIARDYGCSLAAATLGRDGVLAWDGTRFHYASAYCVDAIDTTGAGDIFHAGFIYGLLQSWPIGRQLEFACAAAALNCTAIGARGGIQPIEKIESLMSAGKRHTGALEPSK